MVGFGKVKFFKIFVEDYDGVSDEKVGEMSGEEGIHATIHQLLFNLGINDQVGVQVFSSQSGVIGNIC